MSGQRKVKSWDKRPPGTGTAYGFLHHPHLVSHTARFLCHSRVSLITREPKGATGWSDRGEASEKGDKVSKQEGKVEAVRPRCRW